MSDTLNLSVQAYGQYERGDREPKIEMLIKIASIFHTSIDSLVGYSVEALPEYERYKRYLESIGASVQEDENGIITVETPPARANRPRSSTTKALFESRQGFVEVMSNFERESADKAKEQRRVDIIESIIRYAKTMEMSALAVKVLRETKNGNSGTMEFESNKDMRLFMEEYIKHYKEVFGVDYSAMVQSIQSLTAPDAPVTALEPSAQGNTPTGQSKALVGDSGRITGHSGSGKGKK